MSCVIQDCVRENGCRKYLLYSEFGRHSWQIKRVIAPKMFARQLERRMNSTTIEIAEQMRTHFNTNTHTFVLEFRDKWHHRSTKSTICLFVSMSNVESVHLHSRHVRT